MFLDQRGTTDPVEITNGIADALAKNAGPTAVTVPIGPTPGLGTVIPPGAQVTALLDGDPIIDRIRQITTVLTNEANQPSAATTGVIGSPDSGVASPTQRILSRLLRRVQNLEST
jgi:hypothetical protein